ncbi:hypothetical protein OIU76_015864 [Salix suchowensis]|nr:hypothetical protein OIU76_015864 [Salix suchowensis]
MDGASGCTKSPLWFGLNCFKLPSATVDSYNLSAAQNISFNEEKNGSFQAHLSEAETHYHEFVIQAKPVKRLCRTHNSITVNGLFPGPTLEVRDGDSLVIKAVNNARYNVTLHWNPMDVLKLADFTGAAPNISDAYTINGQPGDLYRCSKQGTVRFPVGSGETILLRVINSALNQELFFGVANHRLTVVAVDAAYTKPFTTSVIMIAPGQTTDVLLTADQTPGHYYMAARAYNTANAPFDNTTTTAILEYKTAPPRNAKKGKQSTPIFPRLPGFNDTNSAIAFTSRLRSPSRVKVPLQIDESLFFAVGLGLINCTNPNSPRCQGPNGTRFAASMNNVSFVLPTRNSLMQAYYQGQPGVFTTDFPPVPPVKFDYTGNVSRGLWQPVKATKLYKLKFGARVQIVLQDTSIVSVEDHPMHLHGYHFAVIGAGFGNFNPRTDPAKFNLIDPPYRNTIGTPPGGWVAIRFEADNPGIWFMHCHLDSHLNWGLAMAFLVENGVGELQSVQPPPLDLPRC